MTEEGDGQEFFHSEVSMVPAEYKIRVRLDRLHAAIAGYVLPHDGTYFITVNANYPPMERKKLLMQAWAYLVYHLPMEGFMIDPKSLHFSLEIGAHKVVLVYRDESYN